MSEPLTDGMNQDSDAAPCQILMVLDQPFPPDIRVLKEADSLVEAGFKVGVLSIGPDDRPKRDSFRGIEIIRFRIPGRLRNILRGLAGTVPLLNWLLRWLIVRVRRQFSFDVLHMHDLYLVGGGLAAGRRTGVPVVADLHENWAQALSLYAWSTRFPGRLLVSRSKWQALEKRWLSRVEHVLVVVEEARQRLLDLGIEPSKVAVVPNTIQVRDFDRFPVRPDIVESIQSPFTIVYTGGINLHRGLQTLIRAMPAVVEAIPVDLVIVGDGSTRGELEQLALDLGISEHVTFTGWRPMEEMRSYIAGSHVCTVPHEKNGQNDYTMPHKLFHYMYMERPVLVTNCRPLERIVNEVKCGLVCTAGDPSSMAEALIQLHKHPEERQRMGANGRQAVLAQYNWNYTARSMMQLYREICT